jgi:hypothetical protein
VVWFPVAAATLMSTAFSLFAGHAALLLVVLIAVLSVAVYWCCLLCFAAMAAIGRHWADCLVRATGLVLIVPLVLLARLSGDYVHFAVMFPYYYLTIATNSYHSARFPWGDRAMGVMDGMQLRTLVYDVSGETEQRLGQLTPDAGTYGGPVCTVRFIGGFFLEYEYSGVIGCTASGPVR